jgi:hypothetical protein
VLQFLRFGVEVPADAYVVWCQVHTVLEVPDLGHAYVFGGGVKTLIGWVKVNVDNECGGGEGLSLYCNRADVDMLGGSDYLYWFFVYYA